MLNRRRLALRRETLAELTTDDTARVVGAASGLPCLSLPECPQSLPDCYSLVCTNGWCASDFQQCTTG